MLSTKMRHAVRELLREHSPKIPKGTLKALQKRELIHEDQTLTGYGKAIAIELCPLLEQCERLSIPCTSINFNLKTNPENDVQEHFKDGGWLVCNTEGGIYQVILASLCLDRLYTNAKKDKGDHLSAISYLYSSGILYARLESEDFEKMKSGLLSDIHKISKVNALENFHTFQSWQKSDTWFPYNYRGINKIIVSAILEHTDRRIFTNIIELLLDGTPNFWNGWPDLCVYKGQEIKQVEVKAKDKLHYSQIITMPKLIESGMNVEVFRVAYDEGC